jgi:hypothetical protein
MSFGRAQRLAFRTVSQTAIAYRKSALSQSLGDLPATAPQPGDRFPWLRLKLSAGAPVEDLFQKFDDLGFDLIVAGQALPEGAAEFGGLVRVHVIPPDLLNDVELARADIPRPSFYLVRPDGHVGLCGGRLDAGAVRRYLAETLRLRR